MVTDITAIYLTLNCLVWIKRIPLLQVLVGLFSLFYVKNQQTALSLTTASLNLLYAIGIFTILSGIVLMIQKQGSE